MARRAAGIGRSLRIYYADPARAARMVALYGRFLRPGALAFDIGAHVGDRVRAFRDLGARVIAVEPQRAPFRALRLIHGRDPGVHLVPKALGAAPGEAEMRVNAANPTVATLSQAFVAAAATTEGWRGEVWDGTERVTVTTLDALIEAHGLPDFTKIDVEGFEDAVLAGLSVALPALSFEVTTLHRSAALSALERLDRLGRYQYALSLGETLVPEADGWIDADAMAERIVALPEAANSGDIYAVRSDRE